MCFSRSVNTDNLAHDALEDAVGIEVLTNCFEAFDILALLLVPGAPTRKDIDKAKDRKNIKKIGDNQVPGEGYEARWDRRAGLTSGSRFLTAR